MGDAIEEEEEEEDIGDTNARRPWEVDLVTTNSLVRWSTKNMVQRSQSTAQHKHGTAQHMKRPLHVSNRHVQIHVITQHACRAQYVILELPR